MPKSTKSSASSGTRKKQAIKAAKKAGQDASQAGKGSQQPSQTPVQRGQKKDRGKRNEPKKKVYVPPVKPKQDVIDPLDSMGLANLLPSDLVVLLRKASKKDVITRIRALEGLIEWINAGQNAAAADQPSEEEDRRSALVIALPSWVHLFPRLAVSPNRRLRQLTMQVSAKLFGDQVILSELAAQPSLVENIIGPMLIIAHGPDRLVSRMALSLLEVCTTWEAEATHRIVLQNYSSNLLDHLSDILFHKAHVREQDSGSSQVSGTSTPIAGARDAKNRDDVNVEEDAEGTDGRLVSGALGGLAWLVHAQSQSGVLDEVIPILTSSTVWTALSPHASESRSLGVLSPSVRVAAWNLVRNLVTDWPQGLDKCLHVMGPHAVTAAFEESDVLVAQNMRESLVRLLRARPDTWKMAIDDANEDEDDEEEDEEDANEDDEEEDSLGEENREARVDLEAQTEDGQGKSSSNGDQPEQAYLKPFLQYLRKGVCGIASSYTMVILLLSTIPDDVFPPTSAPAIEVLQAMYAPVDEGTLEGREAQRSFVTAFVECIVWLSGRVAARTSADAAVEVADCIKMLWYDYIDGEADEITSPSEEGARLSRLEAFGEERMVKELATCLRKLGGINAVLAKPILGLCRAALSKSLTVPAVPVEMVIEVLSKASDKETQPSPALVEAVHELVRDVTCTTANIVASGEAGDEGVTVLVLTVTYFPAAHDEESSRALRLAFDSLLHRGDRRDKVRSSDQVTAFLAAFVLNLTDDDDLRQSWTALLESVIGGPQGLDWSLLRAVSRATVGKEEQLMGIHSPRLDEAFSHHFRENVTISARLIARPDGILQPDIPKKVLSQVAAGSSVSELMFFEEWLKADKKHVRETFDTPELRCVVSRAFEAAVLDGDRQASVLWRLFTVHEQAFDIARESLRSSIAQLNRPVDALIEASETLKPHISLRAIVPDQATLHQTLSSACAAPSPVALCVNDALVPLSGGSDADYHHDSTNLTLQARAQLVLLASIEEDSAQKDVSALPHLASLAIAAEDAWLEPEGGKSHFAASVSEDLLKMYFRRSLSAATSILSAKAAVLDEQWFITLSKVLANQQVPQDDLQTMLHDLWQMEGSARLFARLMNGVLSFSDVGQKEALLLLRIGQSAERSKLDKGRAIYLAAKDYVLETPLYERLRNQYAADLAGIKSHDAAGKGLEALRMLTDLAPPTDSSLPLVPQQRAIFLMQTMQAWLASDDDLPPELFVRLAQLFIHILPVLQDMPGNHLDLIIDVIEMNLGDNDAKDGLGLASLYFTFVLLETLLELSERSITLREVWNDRRKDVFNALRLVILKMAEEPDVQQVGLRSNARLLLEEAAIDVLRFTPASLFSTDLRQLVQLLQSPALTTLPVVAYRLLAHNIREQVKELVVDAAVGASTLANEDQVPDEEDSTAKDAILKSPKKLQIPSEITAVLESPSSTNDMAYLLTWLVTFEYFEESSLELRAAYTTHLQSLRLIDACLLPFVCRKISATTDVSQWALDELFLDDIRPSDRASIEVLTVHVFYRALIHTPNLVRDAFFSIKDRQQSILLRNLTVRHLTPLLSQREFGHLREGGVLDRLQDESMQIKVLGNASEVIATYTVDEYPLEIAITMPNDYPLHPVEVRDLRKIGISEGTWRAWILGMRQLIAGRNGLIFDALLLFKRNVEAKFSGFDEDSTCAICYSIVSPTDHSLPTKPCKTCKKKFHSSCLYKWVSTSGSSTCPLCRSIL